MNFEVIENNQTVVKNADKIYAVVGDNGMCIVNMNASLAPNYLWEALQTLVNVTLFEFKNEETARFYALQAYCSRFFMRNHLIQVTPTIPSNLPCNVIFRDDKYEEREGRLPHNGYFPGLLI